MFGEQIYSTGEPAYKRKSKPQRHAASQKTSPPSCTHVLYPYNKMPVVADSRKRRGAFGSLSWQSEGMVPVWTQL